MNHKLYFLETLSRLDLALYELVATSHGHVVKGVDLILMETNDRYNRDLYIRFFE